MHRPIAKLFTYSLLSASIFLAGCETVGGLKTDADLAIKAINASLKSASTPSTTNRPSNTNQGTARANQDQLDEYQAFVLAEEKMIRRIDEQQKNARMSSVMNEKTMTLTSGRRTDQFLIAGSFRTEIPADAIAARHLSVLSFIDSFAEYVAIRSQTEPATLVLVARSRADALWMQDSVKETLIRLGYENIPVTIEVNSRSKPMVGWFSSGRSTRTLQAPGQ